MRERDEADRARAEGGEINVECNGERENERGWLSSYSCRLIRLLLETLVYCDK